MRRVDTRVQILNLVKEGFSGVTDIAEELGLSKQIVHRYIKELLSEKFILKKGSAPRTEYVLNPEHQYTRVEDDFKTAKKLLLPKLEKMYKRIVVNSPAENIDLGFMLKSSAVYSSNIEGISIDLNSFMHRDKLPRGAQKEAGEVADLVDAYNFAKAHKLDEANFLQAHKMLSANLLSAGRQGVYREEGVGVFGSEGLIYSAPEHFLVQNEMHNLFTVVATLLNKNMSTPEAVFWSSWLHLEIALIHPFIDGNGRMARLLEKWFLVLKTGERAWFLQTEKFYFENRQQYYNNLRQAPQYWEANSADFEGHLKMLFEYLAE